MINLQDDDEKTAFFHAAQEDKSEILEFFMTGWTGKIDAPKSSGNVTSYINWIPDREEDKDKDKDGQSPLMVSLQEGHADCVRILLQTDRNDPESVRDNAKDCLIEEDFAGNNIFHFALQSKQPALMTEILIDIMDKINDKSLTLGLLHKENFDQDTPLHLLAESDQQLDIDNNLVKLMQNLANKKILTECLKKENAEKETSLHVAARKGFKDFIEVINDIGKLVDQESSNSDMKDQILDLLEKKR